MYGIELMIIIVATIGSALAPNNSLMYNIIIIWRVILGLGIGGDYPLSASKYLITFILIFYSIFSY
jgi:PHS family inorganic phosphate transporter-like MFS transporter